MTRTVVAEVKATEGIYRAADVARHFKVHRSTVCRIWNGQAHVDVPPAPDFPDIATPLRSADLQDAISVLLEGGRTVNEVAQDLGVSVRTVYKVKAAKVGMY